MLKEASQVEVVGAPLSEGAKTVRWTAWACVALYLALVVGVLAGILRADDRHMVYSLDDPYIHLALAENIAHGHYGINASEPSSPSSTLLWPFMLVPLAGTAWHQFVPLFWNVLFGIASAFAIGHAMARWMPLRGEKDWLGRLKQIGLGALLVVVGNLVGLTFLGMEHTLQVFIAILCALGCADAWEGRPVPVWSVVAAVVAPSVRYEDVILTLAASLALFATRERKKAAAVMVVSLVPLVLFGLFLKAHGLPALPTSVMVKGNVYADDSGFFGSLMQTAGDNIHSLWKLPDDLRLLRRFPERLPMFALLLIFVGLLVREKIALRRYVLLGAVLAAALQIAFGRFGWFHRYEIYAVLFLTLLLVRIAADKSTVWLGLAMIVPLWVASLYVEAIPQTVQSSQEVYGQQYQMRRFMNEYWRGDVAVNDLGLVSFQKKPANRYVLDVYGLASVEASQQADKTDEWLEGIVKRHRVKLAMVYPNWFDIPDSWVPEGRMCLDRHPVIVASQCMVFYSTAPESAGVIKDELHRFASTLPRSTKMYFLPEQEGQGPP